MADILLPSEAYDGRARFIGDFKRVDYVTCTTSEQREGKLGNE